LLLSDDISSAWDWYQREREEDIFILQRRDADKFKSRILRVFFFFFSNFFKFAWWWLNQQSKVKLITQFIEIKKIINDFNFGHAFEKTVQQYMLLPIMNNAIILKKQE